MEDLTTSDGELDTDITAPIVEDNYAIAMMSPIVPLPNVAGNFLTTLTIPNWFLLLTATLFVSTVTIRLPKHSKYFALNFDLVF